MAADSTVFVPEKMARVCQFILATVTVGTNGAVLAKYEIDDFLIFTEALATIALVTSAIRLFCPMKWNFKTFLYDFLQLVAWAIALGFLANEIREIKHCGFSWYHYAWYYQGAKCGLIKSTTSCAFLSVFAWFASFILGAGWCCFKVIDKSAARRAGNTSA